jgi:alginate O-acetyltransferase complex protein AlgI
MIFSNPTFLFLFLPILLLAYTLSPRRLKNSTLLLASLFFYAWGEPWFVLVMLGSIACNYAFGLGLEKYEHEPLRRRLVLAAAVFNLGLLAAFKYAGFFVENANALLVSVGGPQLPEPEISLPIGISFFTFQALSYVVDVYRGQADVQRDPVDFALFVALFPQLIAGPIVRYRDVATQITSRQVRVDDFSEGIRRFVVGLAKKVLIANTVAEVADPIFALPGDELTAGLAWLGRSATRSKSTSTSQATPTWPLASACFSDSATSRTSTTPMSRRRSLSSGGAGTYPFQRGCGITSTFPLAEAASQNPAPI